MGDRGLFTTSVCMFLVIKKFSQVSFALCWPRVRLAASPGRPWQYQIGFPSKYLTANLFLPVAATELAGVRGGSRRELGNP